MLEFGGIPTFWDGSKVKVAPKNYFRRELRNGRRDTEIQERVIL